MDELLKLAGRKNATASKAKIKEILELFGGKPSQAYINELYNDFVEKLDAARVRLRLPKSEERDVSAFGDGIRLMIPNTNAALDIEGYYYPKNLGDYTGMSVGGVLLDKGAKSYRKAEALTEEQLKDIRTELADILEPKLNEIGQEIDKFYEKKGFKARA